MRTDFENMVKGFLPALRARSAKLMSDRYKLTQQDIASLLETTQAAVSKYLNGKYSKEVKDMEKQLNDNEVNAFVANAIKNRRYEAQVHVCKMCSRTLTHKCNLMIK